MIANFLPNDLLSSSKNIVKKSIIQAFFTILVISAAAKEIREGMFIFSIN